MGAQFSLVLLQFIYAAIATRLVSAEAFGTYAVATLTMVLVSILTAAGLGQAMARSEDESESLIRSLCTIALFLGFTGLLLIVPFAQLWAGVWGAPEATPSIALIAFASLVTPSVGLLSGLLRRQHKFKALAVCTVVGSSIGLALGVLLVLVSRTAESLTGGLILSQFLIYLCLLIATRGQARPGRLESSAATYLLFSWRVSIANLLAFGIENVTRVAVTRGLGSAALGYWNRAEVVTTTPFARLFASISQTLYPQFRPNSSEKGASTRSAHVLVLLAGLGMPIAGFLAGSIPVVSSIVFGPEWDDINGIATVLAIAAGLNGASTQLAAMLEAKGKFQWIWISYVFLLIMQIGMAILVFKTSSIWPAVVGALVVPILRHLIQVAFAHRAGLLEVKQMRKGYLEAIAMAAVCFAASFSLVEVLLPMELPAYASLLFLSLEAFALLGVWVLLVRRTEIGRILRSYNLFPRMVG